MLRPRIERCFEAGALATGCELAIRDLSPAYSHMVTDSGLIECWRRNAEELGRSYPAEDAGAPPPMFSTDMANVSLAVPTIHPLVRIETGGAVNHQPEFAAACVGASATQGSCSTEPSRWRGPPSTRRRYPRSEGPFFRDPANYGSPEAQNISLWPGGPVARASGDLSELADRSGRARSVRCVEVFGMFRLRRWVGPDESPAAPVPLPVASLCRSSGHGGQCRGEPDCRVWSPRPWRNRWPDGQSPRGPTCRSPGHSRSDLVLLARSEGPFLCAGSCCRPFLRLFLR